ncbi:MAG: metalloregulator ArsR/SmtB family transcription factor [Elusimicrobia bacterium]|nr:metalloregulator ArsR/SmtB family transcription factor [Elusimicrobiota bacterium]
MHKSAYKHIKRYHLESNIKIFKSLADKTRLRIVKILMETGKPICVCDLVEILKLAQYNLSRHMKELKNAGLVSENKQGRFVFYSLRPAVEEFQHFIYKAVKGISEKYSIADIKCLEKCRIHPAPKEPRS